MKKRERKMESPKTNFTVWLTAEKSLNAATAQEALQAALVGLGVTSVKVSNRTDSECVSALHKLAKPMEDGTKRIHRYSLPWNLRFDAKEEKLLVREVESADEVKSTGRLTKQTESAILPSVVKNHTKQIEDLNEALKSQVAEFSAVLKNQVELNALVNKRLASLEAAVAALQKPTAPAKSSKKTAVVETGDLFEQPKSSTKKAPAKSSKKKVNGVDLSDLGF